MRLWHGFVCVLLPKIHGETLEEFFNMKKIQLFLLCALSLVSGLAAAVLPASVAPTLVAIQTDGQSLFDLVFPIVAVFVGLSIIIKLFKRFSNKV